MKKIFKNALKKCLTFLNQLVLRPLGLNLSRDIPEFGGLRYFPAIQTVIDVGVADGTPWLYSAFPNAYLMCFEANPEYFDKISNFFQKRAGELFPVALGSEEKTAQFFLRGAGSGFHAFSKLVFRRNEEFKAQEVKIKRLDQILSEKKVQRPSLLKVDTEGFELEVLKGASGVLAEIDFIIVETSVLKRFDGSYKFFELTDFLRNSGFELFQILSATPDPRGLIRYCDLVFAKKPWLDSKENPLNFNQSESR